MKGLNPSVGVHDRNVSAHGAVKIICTVWMKICQKLCQCCQAKTCGFNSQITTFHTYFKYLKQQLYMFYSFFRATTVLQLEKENNMFCL